MKIAAIVNPQAGRGQAAKVWPRLLAAQGERSRSVVTWWTEWPGHAEYLAAQAKRDRFERIIAAGGDGTLFEVANGLWWEPGPREPLPSIGIVPFGTGCDYVRNFQMGRGAGEHLACALSDATVNVAAGLVRCRALNNKGNPILKIYLNHLGVGFDAQVIKRFRQLKLPLKGKLPYGLALLRELASWHTYLIEGEIDGKPFHQETAILVAGLGRYFAGGMQITPGASPQSECLQLMWIDKPNLLDLVHLFLLVYTGQHIRHSLVHTTQARKFQARVMNPELIEADGELVGQSPLEVEIIPQAFRIAAPKLKSPRSLPASSLTGEERGSP